MKVHEIREQKAKLVAQMRELLGKAESEKRELSGDEVGKFEQLKTEVEGLEKKEERAAFMENVERSQSIDPSFQQVTDRITVLGAIQSAINGDVTGALREFNQETERRTGKKAEGIYLPLSSFEKRAAQTTTTAAGIVPVDNYPNEFIGPLRKSLLMRKLGIRTLTGLRGDVSIPKYKTGMTAGWVNENEALSKSGMTFDGVSMKPKHVGALTELSRQLIQQSSPDINSLVTDDLSFIMADALDKAILYGDGVKQPLGILKTAGIQKASLATADWETILALSNLLDIRDIENAQYLTNPSVISALQAIEKSKGTAQYLATKNSIGDVAASVTNQVAGSDLLLGDFSQFILGVWSEVDLLVNPYAEEAYSRGNVLIRALMTVGAVCRHPEAFLYIDDAPVNSVEGK